MAAMLMLPTYGAMASSVKKEIYEKEKNTQNYCNYFSNNYTGGRYVYKCHIT